LNTKDKINLDRYWGYPLALAMNVLARIAGFFLNIDHSLNKLFKTIVVSKFEGMGSIIQASPLLLSLRQSYPEAKIVFVTSSSNRTLLEKMPFVNEILTIEGNGFLKLLDSIAALIFKLWKLKADVYIDLEVHSNFSSIIATASLATNRLGFFKSEKNYKMGLFTHMMYFNQKSAISETYLQFTRLLNCSAILRTLYKFEIGPEQKRIAEKELSGCGLFNGDRYIVINPNASDLRLERKWPAKNFNVLINALLKNKPDYKLVLTGSRPEMDYIDSVLSGIKNENLINTAGKLSLSALILLIENARLMITNDTGPMHLAFAQGTKTVALFGPCAPSQYGNHSNTNTIYKNVYCSPCVHEFIYPPCNGNNQCMKLISNTEVLAAVDSALNDVPFNDHNSGIIYESEFTLGQVLRN
jgi:ADP-heptose:LPS heptosyltransferase